eukprot:TRINITY_DN2901_c0_g1_i2.p1 TRINITY_DN2901_c0_g1~~TRINITY_DN2901_c0_g1_i2.p1  ORF type:complete len:263 (-),score=6.98 TRINITY_DN2901_c0_g1_i2:53-841(-)
MRVLSQPIAARGYRVLSFDFYGRGHSGSPLGDVRHNHLLLAAQTAELLKVLEERNIITHEQAASYHVVALSLGGSVSVVHTSEFPDRIKTLTLLAPAGLTFEVPSMSRIATIPFIGPLLQATNLGRVLMDRRVPGAFVDPEHADVVSVVKEFKMLNHFHLSRDDFVKAFMSTLAHYPLSNTTEWYKKVGELKFPVLFIWGEEDRTIPIECLKEGQALIPRAETVILPKAGHMALNEKNSDVVKSTVKFLQTGTLKDKAAEPR